MILKIKGKIKLNSNYFNPLSPSKAAFYSAIFPGWWSDLQQKILESSYCLGCYGYEYLFILRQQ